MDGLILAAGMATRLRPLTNNKPKALLELNNKPIINYIIDNLLYFNIDKIIIVTGYKGEMLREHLKKNYPDIRFVFVENKEYETTNNSYSLLLAENYITDEFLLLDSDIIFERNIIKLLVSNSNGGVKLAVKKHKLADEEIKVIMKSDNQIIKIGKELDPKISYGESIGIEYFPSDTINVLFKTLRQRILIEKKYNEFYEASFQQMINNGIKFWGIDVGKLEAVEIDYMEDLKKAEKIIKKWA